MISDIENLVCHYYVERVWMMLTQLSGSPHHKAQMVVCRPR